MSLLWIPSGRSKLGMLQTPAQLTGSLEVPIWCLTVTRGTVCLSKRAQGSRSSMHAAGTDTIYETEPGARDVVVNRFQFNYGNLFDIFD